MKNAAATKETTMTATRAIQQSIQQDEIVHLPRTDALAADLLVECEDTVDAGAVEEFWGTDDSGSTWRVHLDR